MAGRRPTQAAREAVTEAASAYARLREDLAMPCMWDAAHRWSRLAEALAAADDLARATDALLDCYQADNPDHRQLTML